MTLFFDRGNQGLQIAFLCALLKALFYSKGPLPLMVCHCLVTAGLSFALA